ncbi:MAG: nucleoside deaminase [Candidatus Omnitrophica bacterium]|nr:nucleoside deaminase [Candidatus Omnitrophota bacterium]
MQRAIDDARSGVDAGDGGPFGAVIVKDGVVLATCHNTVLLDNDPTQHAEVRAISKASRKIGSFDLSGCEIYSTTEPCPMCFSAIHWARINTLYYGTTIDDVRKLGFNELTIPAAAMKDIGKSPIKIVPSFLFEKCAELLGYWERTSNSKVY